jgi:hypothetical protein
MINEYEDIEEQWVAISKKLNKIEIREIELRQLGYSYKEISKKLKEDLEKERSEKLIRQHFYKKGKLRQAYDVYCEMLIRESIEVGKLTINSSVDLASKTLLSLMQKDKKDEVRLRASVEILDRTLGKPVQTENINLTDMSKIEENNNEIKKMVNEISNIGKGGNAKAGATGDTGEMEASC